MRYLCYKKDMRYRNYAISYIACDIAFGKNSESDVCHGRVIRAPGYPGHGKSRLGFAMGSESFIRMLLSLEKNRNSARNENATVAEKGGELALKICCKLELEM